MEELHRLRKDAPFGWLAAVLAALKRLAGGGPRVSRAAW